MTTHTLPSYIDPARVGPWGMFLEQLERVEPHLGPLAEWLDTLRHPKRCLIVDVPVRMDDGRIRHFEWLPRPAQPVPRAGQGRRALPPGRDPLGGDGPVGLDDGEERRG